MLFQQFNFDERLLDGLSSMGYNKPTPIQEQAIPIILRAAYLMREVFDFDYDAIQKVLDKKADHCRQLFSRAKKKLSDSTSKIHFELPDSHLLESFKKACSASPSIFIQDLKNDISKPAAKNL